jgi:acyl-CoA reductase-like NAD-dependent aldehyde dehydrogenase
MTINPFREGAPRMSLSVINPYDQTVYRELALETIAGLEEKIRAARAAAISWREVPLAERVHVVRSALDYFRSHQDRIAAEITAQMGKPIREAHNEFGGFFERAAHMLSIAEDTLAPEELPPKDHFHRRIERAPLGVVLNIAAWNYPLLIAVNVVVPALVAGNSVLLKHSARTPLCGTHFQAAFNHRPGLLTHLLLSHAQTLDVIRDPRIDHVVFTGSVSGGRRIHQAAAGRFIDLGLELGGKDPAYVAEDADLAFSVPNIVDGALYNAGQSCCAVERVYVHQNNYASFLEQAAEAMTHFKPGDPLDPATTLGPLADRAALDVLDRQVHEALQRGARLICGGRRLEGSPGNFYLPTLLADVDSRAEVMQEESFGPLLPVQAVADDAEALEQMNNSRYGLTASIWTRSRTRAEWFAARLEAGTVYQNRCDYLDPGLAWTGVKDSGRGVSLSRYGYHGLTRPKSIHFRELPE